MAKIKKLKENGATIYPATIPEAVVDTNGFSLTDFIDNMLTVLSLGDREHFDLAFSDLQAALGSGNSLDMFIDKVNSFLSDAGASQGVIDSWKEIEDFLAGITDTETLTGLLTDTLNSAKSYADSKVSSATANAVTMSSNAGAADRVMVSAGANKTAKASDVALSSLAKTDMSNVSLQTLLSKGLAGIRVHEYTLSGDTLQNLNGFMSGISVGDGLLHIAKDEYGYAPISVVEDPTTGSVACMFVASNRRLYYVYADDDTGSYVSKSTFIGDAASTEVDGLMSAADKTKLNGISENANNYTLPVATASELGGVKSGGNITVGLGGTVTVNQATKASQDKNGADIATTYLKASAVADVTDYKEITI